MVSAIFDKIDFKIDTAVIVPQIAAIFEGRKTTLEFGDYNVRFIALQLKYLTYPDLFTSLTKELTEGRAIIEVKQANGKRYIYATQEVAKTLTLNEEIEKIEEIDLTVFAKLAEKLSQFLATYFSPKEIVAQKPADYNKIHSNLHLNKLTLNSPKDLDHFLSYLLSQNESKIAIKIAENIKSPLTEQQEAQIREERKRKKEQLQDEQMQEYLRREILKFEKKKFDIKRELSKK